jgi:tetratricopeptide (TPR) repeat protein
VGDSAGAEHSYERSGNSAAFFNMALMQSKQRRYDDALANVDKALEITHARAYQVLKADIVEQLGRPQEARLLYQDALNGQLQLEGKDGWELHWLAKAARKLDAGEHRQAIEAQQKTWQESVRVIPRIGVLPDQGPMANDCDGTSIRQVA